MKLAPSNIQFEVINLSLQGRTLEETGALFDGETVPQDLATMGGEAASMTMSRIPTYYQETTVHYEKSGPERDILELEDSSSNRSMLSFASQSAESDVLPSSSKAFR